MPKLQTLTILTVFALLSMSSTSVSASIREEQTEARNAIKTNKMERKVERQEERGERRDDQLERIANRVEARFKNQTAWLTRWLDRATAQIQKRKDQGKDVTAASATLATAKSDLDKAKLLGEAAVAALKAVQPAAWSEQKAEAKAARQAVVIAQKAFAQVLQDLGPVVKELRKTS